MACLTALTTGKVDAIDYVDYKVADRVNKIDNIDVVETNGGLNRTLPMHTDTAPFNDNNVRLAIKYSVDREALVKTILQGHGEVGNDHPIGSNSRFFNKELEQRTYDPDKAKFYLKKAGLSDLQLNLSAADAGGIGAVDMAILFKEHAKKSGISITVIREPEDGYWSNVWLKKPWCLSYWGGNSNRGHSFYPSLCGGRALERARWEKRPVR